MTTNKVDKIERVERLRVPDSVAAQLTQLITQGVYSIGEKLPSERVLSEEFGVSRSSMREAIRSVEANGLVNSNHGVGVFVVNNKIASSNRSAAEMLIFEDFTVPELFQVRKVMEKEAAEWAAKQITPEQASKLRQILEKCEKPGLSDEEFVVLDFQLHQTVAEASGNRLLAILYGGLEPMMLKYSRRVIGLPGRRQDSHAGHTKLVNAVISGKVREARSAATAHILDVERDIARSIAGADGE